MNSLRRGRDRALVVAVAAVALASASCGYTGSAATQVRQWAGQNSLVTNEQQVLADVHSLRLAVTKGSPLQLRTVCGGLSSDTGTLYDTLPTPDHRLTSDLGAAMEDFFSAAERCAVAPSTKGGDARRALVLVKEGLRELAVARSRLLSFGVRSPAPG
ncbi:MAG: hypothetical protein ACYDGN_01165 [Acidimicrobiales bacterium]